jgi:PPK2 family polyphosphate:nucleotide phosphotransferase
VTADSVATLLRIPPGGPVDLASFDTGATLGLTRETADAQLEVDLDRLSEAQEQLWASKSAAVLVVLQGIDTAGKDGTIRHVIGAFNPQGCRVVPFGVPTADELAHDYLWRVHQHTPGRGYISVFNRSHYEDVLVVRVHELVPEPVWRRRFDEINAFEAHLAANGTTIVKIFLAISRDEQRERLQARVDTPEKRWKFSLGDLDERALWDDYRRAYDEALERCSTAVAPWYLVPSDRKWVRNAAVARILVETFDRLDLRYPEPAEGITGLVVR